LQIGSDGATGEHLRLTETAVLGLRENRGLPCWPGHGPRRHRWRHTLVPPIADEL